MGFSYIHAHLQSVRLLLPFQKKKWKILPAPRGADAWNIFQIVMPFDVTPLKECVPSEEAHSLMSLIKMEKLYLMSEPRVSDCDSSATCSLDVELKTVSLIPNGQILI